MEIVRRRVEVRGRVQGVGFRPFIFRLAGEQGLAGVVGNHSRGAFIELEGELRSIKIFLDRLAKELPPLAKITNLHSTFLEVKGDHVFRIDASLAGEDQDTEVTPDVNVCADCLAELFDPADRRYRYPFINCTNCGPRYSIIRSVPYDRVNTTMLSFKMCSACQAEYDDPTDRRFHAQPNACSICGPHVWLTDAHGVEIKGDAVRLCARKLADGQIIAIKGIGGFHLACRADDDAVVERLRFRKSREAKPFALMVPSLADARKLAEIDQSAAGIMSSAARPIVLLPKKASYSISEHVAPATECFGIMLPYTPLHYLLFAEGSGPLVMTSGNPSEEPLCCDNAEALARLKNMADGFLLHDRIIERRVDDSVVMAGGVIPSAIPIRRSRGYVPSPIRLSHEAKKPILAVGGELKSTICILNGTDAVLSEHLGELSDPATYRNFVRSIDYFKQLFQVEPAVLAYDFHPDYAATRYARGQSIPQIAVQHHHAHIASCMADNGITGNVVGIACDGTGYGTDGAIWGCEVFAGDETEYRRFAHLDYFSLPGGDSAAHEIWRPAVALLRKTFGERWRQEAEFVADRIPNEALGVVEQQLQSSARIPRTSSLGRLFDAVAFLLNICDHNRYEAEAAIALEAAARQCEPVGALRYRIVSNHNSEPFRLDWRPLIQNIIEDLRAGRSRAELARAFHETVAALLIEAANRAAQKSRLNRVVLSGGCFANRLLLEELISGLKRAGREVFSHQNVPTGDGGLSLGQAVIAAERLRRDG